MQETLVQSLDREDPLKKEWLPIPEFLPEELHGRGAWQAAVHGVTKQSPHTHTFFTYMLNFKYLKDKLI